MGPNQESNMSTPSGQEIKLIIDNSLLEQEKRITKTLGDSLDSQNKIYMDQIVSITGRVSKLEVKIDGFKGLIASVAAATSVFAGLIGFFIAQITGNK